MALVSGNIAFVGFNADGNDNIAFVALVDIAIGETIIFEDNEWNGTAFADTNEGAFSWTASSLVLAGTIVRIDNIGVGTIAASTGTAATPVTGRGANRGIAGAAETIYAYQGSAAAPTFITAVTNGGFTVANGVLTNTGLTAGTNAIDLSVVDPDADIAVYNGTRSGQSSFSSYLTLINNPANWLTQDGTGDQSIDLIAPDLPFSSTAFQISGGNPTVNLSVSSNTGSEATPADITVTATASSAVSGNQTVTLTVTGTNITTGDYTLNSANTNTVTITILSGQTTGTATFKVVDDALVEGAETATLTLSSPSSGVTLGSTTTQNIAITDNDVSANPTVNLSVSSNSGSEATPADITVTATASSAVSGNQTVTLTVTGTNITTGDYTLNAATTDTVTITILSGQTTGAATFRVVDDALVEGSETATLTISSPSSGIILGGTTFQNITIADNDVGLTLISSIQGSGTAATAGTFTIEGIVVGDFQGANQLGGFYLQEEDTDADGNVLTSEGIFVSSLTAVNVGDKVRVTGVVAENSLTPSFNQAVITPSDVSVLATGQQSLVTASVVDLPITVLGDLERYEGMLITIPEALTVTEVFNLGRFGEISLSANGRLFNPTNIIDPNDSPASGTTSSGTSNVAAVTAQQNLNNRSRIILDDGSTASNLSDVPYIDTTDASTLNDTLRIGSTISGLTGILGFGFNAYRIQATQAPTINYEARPELPIVGGSVKVGSFNVLNYFNGDGLGGGFPTSRGADSTAEFSRQRAKIISAIAALNADVVGLIEMENDGDDANSAIADLVNGLNALLGAGTYAAIPLANTTGSAGTDAIKVAFIYKPSALTPVGNAVYFNDAAFTSLGRPPLAQTFSVNATGEKFTPIVNHFKSKSATGATGLDVDQLDGQGAFNNTRKTQATALLNFVSQIQTASGDSDVMILGDINAYIEEDPIDIIRAGGFTKLTTANDSFVFDGQTGSLDHALVTSSLLAQVTGAAKWAINSSEPIALDYNNNVLDSSETSAELRNDTTLYSANPFRSSDHDPVLVGINLRPTNNAPAIVTSNNLSFDSSPFDAFGWRYGTSVLQNPPSPFPVVTGNQVSLNTIADPDIRAGFFRNDQTLDRTLGYNINFTAQILSESRELSANKNNDGLDDRAGFSVIAIGNDLKGLEIGFFSDRIWVQQDGASPTAPNLFTQAESVSFDTTKQATYTLTVSGNKYTLQAKEIGGTNATATLYGVLRDYSTSGVTVTLNGQTVPVYNTPNFIFFGDDTTSARASFNLSNISVSNGATAIALPSLAENSVNNAVVGTLQAVDIDGNLLTYSITGGNTNGAFAINNNGQVTVANSTAINFETNPNFNLTVQVSDGSLIDTATVAIALTNVNEAATNVNLSSSSVTENSLVGTTIAIFNPLDVDTLATGFTYSFVDGFGFDNSAFSIDNIAKTLKVNSAIDFETKSSYTIRVKADDGSASPLIKELTVNVIDLPEFIISSLPTSGNDTIVGTSGNDIISSLAGDDFINGGDGNDSLNGGDGNDSVFGGNGNDALLGGTGNDILNGGAGVDSINGGAGADIISYSALSDSVFGTGTSGNAYDTVISFNANEDKFRFEDSASKTVNTASYFGVFATGTTLATAATNAGASLASNDAVFFKIGTSSTAYLLVNNGVAGYSPTDDLFVRLQSFTFKTGDGLMAGSLTASNYFVTTPILEIAL
jgi:hypothetical protein